MNFSQTILEKLGSIFKQYNLRILEQQESYIKLSSDNLVLIFAHNQLENSNTFWMGKNDEKRDKVEIDNKLLKLFFKSDLRLAEVSTAVFISNLHLFFEDEGRPFLMGDLGKIDELEKFDLERSRSYTQDIQNQRILMAANAAWDNANYAEFVYLIGQIKKDKLPSSYLLKYKIANQKLTK